MAILQAGGRWGPHYEWLSSQRSGLVRSPEGKTGLHQVEQWVKVLEAESRARAEARRLAVGLCLQVGH